MADILIVDDDADLSEIVRDLLEEAGHTVRTASNGREGLRQLAQGLPDVVLLDVEMPVLTGPEMSYQMLVHDLGQEEVPIVLLSGISWARRTTWASRTISPRWRGLSARRWSNGAGPRRGSSRCPATDVGSRSGPRLVRGHAIG